MARNARGKRDGSGPYSGSFQRKTSGNVGKRKAAGEKCPHPKKK